MKFYNFDESWPYTAIIYAKDEKDAIAKYIEEVTDTLEEEEQKLVPSEIDVDDIITSMKEDYGEAAAEDYRKSTINEALAGEFTQVVLIDRYLL